MENKVTVLKIKLVEALNILQEAVEISLEIKASGTAEHTRQMDYGVYSYRSSLAILGSAVVKQGKIFWVGCASPVFKKSGLSA